jgi:hypothetical protein
VPDGDAAVGQRDLRARDTPTPPPGTSRIGRRRFRAFHAADPPAGELSVTLRDARVLDAMELRAVERARTHLATHPEATVGAVVRVAFPSAYVTVGNVDAHWETTLRPGLSALTEVDVEAVADADAVVEETTRTATADVETVGDADATVALEAAGDLNARGEPVVDATNVVDSTTAPADEATAADRGVRDGDGWRSGEAAPPTVSLAADDAPAADEDEESQASDGIGFDLPGSFVVHWVDADDRQVRVAGEGHGGTFDVVDRESALGVRPTDDSHLDDEAAPDGWYVVAADALEAGLPDEVAALDGAAIPWPDEGLRVAFEFTDDLNCRTLDDGGVHRVTVTDDDHSAVLRVERGVARFEDGHDGYPGRWATEAVAAAEAHVLTGEHANSVDR